MVDNQNCSHHSQQHNQQHIQQYSTGSIAHMVTAAEHGDPSAAPAHEGGWVVSIFDKTIQHLPINRAVP